MITLKPEDLSTQDNYKLLVGSVIPRPIALVTTQSEEGLVNLAPFSFFNVVSSNPPVLSLSVQRMNGEMKDTARHLLATKEAVLHIVDEENVAEANKTAATLPAEMSELTISNFETIPSDVVRVPAVKPAKARYETTLLEYVPVKKGEMITADFFLLEIKAYHLDEAIYEAGRINPKALGAVSRLAGNNYAEIGDLFSIERPE
ncbi:flavin reductase family protein [Vagococcus lutrae]|uniref:flavin reductase family protein n=1 Tax=Vagococcus lutrae TaxID=81947 RepID=UPI00288E3D94|nr:flavin reductase family protein [Vagococcus lutrae]MDT2808597.1 flavin reductase family protein [Vagococcus lutrae]MDY3706394.1 flavin reductase family protein [Vagococcus lutrae]